MKKLFSSFRKGLATTGLILFAAVLFSACKKTDYGNSGTNQTAALMAFNLVSDKPGVVVTLSNNTLTQGPLQYQGFTGGYLNIYAGTRNIQAYDYTNTGTAITNSSYPFDVNKYYSLFVVGANNVYSNVVAVDNYDSLSAANGQAYVRYINAIPDSSNPRVTITAGLTNISTAPAHFGTVSQFTQIVPGQVTVNVSNDASIQATRTITLEQQKAYTLLLTGVPGATDSSKAVQIRFIENGRLTP